MADETSVPLTSGLPETVLPAPPAEAARALAMAFEQPGARRAAAVAEVAAAFPRYLEAWATLAELAETAGDPVASYAYARVGYHRGLDAARGAGWRGSGYVRWRHEDNRGFLRSLDALRLAAETIGEADEAERCSLFLRQLDPDWGRHQQ
jgi:hypothetical protein